MTIDAFTANDSGETAATAGARSDERLLGIFLSRLRRLMRHRAERSSALNPEGIRLLDRAIFSTYCDCRTLGGQAIAQGIIRSEPRLALPKGSGAGVPV